jgi:hypothetical protein
MDDRSVTRPVGVYDAASGLLGEAAYVWGTARGTRQLDALDGLVARLGPLLRRRLSAGPA